MMDILLERKARPEAIRQALATAFGVSADLVRVVMLRDLIRDPSGPARPIHAEVVRTRGDFRTLVKLEVTQQHETADRVGLARRLSSLLDSSLLIPAPDRNPYSWLLVGQSHGVRRVDLDAESMDEREEYRLARGSS